MGTSKSSSGPGKNVGLVPPWLDVPETLSTSPSPFQPPPDVDVGTPSNLPPLEQPAPTNRPPQTELAEPRRFAKARRALGTFIQTGDPEARRCGLGGYVKKGYGGAQNASSRMGQAATTASRAYDVLNRLSNGSATSEELGFNPATLAGADIDVVVDALVDIICRNDTTLDDAAGRNAVSEALSEVLESNPDLDPMALPQQHIQEVWLRTLAYDTYDTLMRDIGGGLTNAAKGDFRLLNDRRIEIRDFIRECFRERIDVFEVKGIYLTPANCDSFSREIIRSVMDIFEEWFK